MTWRAHWFAAVLAAVLLVACLPSRAEEGSSTKPAEPTKKEMAGEGPPKKKKTEKDKGKKEEKLSEPPSDPRAVELFNKAVSWQGEPRLMKGRLHWLNVEELLFKAYGQNEIEGRFRILYEVPNKIHFKVSTPSWWRSYCSNGKTFWWKTGAMNRGWEKLQPKKKKEHLEKTVLIKQALRVVRLLFLRSFLDDKARFYYMGMQSYTRGGVEMDPAHLVKCKSSGEEPVYFYLGKRGGMPKCIVVHSFLYLKHPNRTFFIHLDGFKNFDGIRLPTRIRMYIRHLASERDEKFLFCDLVHNEKVKVKVNTYIQPGAFDPRK